MGFRKAKAEQAALKIGMYGPAGSGKTFTALLFAEGLGLHEKKRVAFVDTERGTDFYCKAVKARSVHPEAFDFDALYTRSITDVLRELKALDAKTYGVIVLDSISHIWEAAIAAYKGKTTSIGSIPMHAWGNIKKPYKELMNFLLSTPMHVIICGRQSNEFDDVDGELKKVGVKMKAEGETAYEPHICLRMSVCKHGNEATVQAFGEKDRTGILANRTIDNPNFKNCIEPLLSILGDKQAKIESEDETASHDAEALADEEAKKAEESSKLCRQFLAKMDLAEGKEALDAVSKEITPAIKKRMLPNHVAQLREKYQALTQSKVTESEAE